MPGPKMESGHGMVNAEEAMACLGQNESPAHVGYMLYKGHGDKG